MEQIEQDLLLARVIVAVYSNPFLRDELVFRGGTCLHQVHLITPLRYSEDLDFVRRTHTGIGPIFDALRAIADEVGLDVHDSQRGHHPKMRFQAPATDSAGTLRIKVEINTHETSSAASPIQLPFDVESPWFTGGSSVTTFIPAELIATKIRALYQRSKGRDLFDLWLALEHMRVDPARVLACFAPYRPHGYSRRLAISNLERKLADDAFRSDLSLLVATWPVDYDIDDAGQLVIQELLSKVE